MSGSSPQGVLREGWKALVDDYAIAGGWACGGDLLVVGDAAGNLFGFDGKSGATRWETQGAHPGGLLALSIQPGGTRVATAGQDGRVQIWNAKDGTVELVVELGSGWVEHLEWSADGQMLAAALSRRVSVLDVEGRTLWQSDPHRSTVSALAWSASHELVTACYGQVTFYGGTSGEVLQTFEWKGSLVSMVLSPDGDIVACGSQDNTVHFWRRSTEEDSMMAGYPGKPSSLAFDSTGTLLATSGGPSVTVWSFAGDGPEGTRPGILDVHVQPVTVLSFAQSERKLASGARDGAVVLWGVKEDGDGGPIGADFIGEVISALTWRSDGRALAALDAAGGVTVWRVAK